MAIPRVVVLSGVSGAGKTTLARAFQQTAPEPFVYLAFDDYHQQMPAWLDEHSPAAGRWIEGFHRSIAAHADVGSNVVVDHLFLARSWFEELFTLLEPHAPLSVAVWCDFATLNRRGRARDRSGLAATQVANHQYHNASYHVSINSALPTRDNVLKLAADGSCAAPTIEGQDIETLIHA